MIFTSTQASNTPWWKTEYQQDPLVSKHSNRPKPFICSKYWSLWNKFPLKIHDFKLFHVAYYQKPYEILKFKVLCQEIRYITHILLIFRILWQHTYFLGRKLGEREEKGKQEWEREGGMGRWRLLNSTTLKTKRMLISTNLHKRIWYPHSDLVTKANICL